jgi:hypothetical protein
MAIANGAALETIALLFRSGASTQIDTPDEFGRTPIGIAVERARDEIVQLLREFQKAKPS